MKNISSGPKPSESEDALRYEQLKEVANRIQICLSEKDWKGVKHEAELVILILESSGGKLRLSE